MATCHRIRLLSLGLIGAAAALWPLATAGSAQLLTPVTRALTLAPAAPAAPIATGPAIANMAPAMPVGGIQQIFAESLPGLLTGALPLVVIVPGLALLLKAYSQRKGAGNAAYVNFAVGSWLLIVGGAALSVGQLTPHVVNGISVGCGGF